MLKRLIASPLFLFAHDIFGFESVEDFAKTLLGSKNRNIYMWDFMMVVGGTCLTLITRFVWTDYTQFFTILSLVLIDAFLGSHIAWKKGRFQTRKFIRSLWVLVYYTIALGVVHNFASLKPEFALFVPVVFYWLLGKTFLSIMKNLALLGVPMPPGLKKMVLDRIDAFKDEATPKKPKENSEED